MSKSMTASTSEQQSATKRIEYIDALRGFTMILVVLHHVADCWGVVGLDISVHEYLLQVRMPMFFFISGFVLYKSTVVWNTSQVIGFFRKKIPVQLIAPFLFFVLFIHGDNVLGQFCLHSKCKFWFTFVLFEYYVFYAAIRFFIRKWWSDIILVALGLFLYFINWPIIYDSIPVPEYVKGFFSMQGWNYFLFFALGTLVKKHFSHIEKWFENSLLLAICILFYFLVNGFSDSVPDDKTLICLPITLCGLFVLFSYFHNHQAAFKKDKAVGRTLQFIGRRTLDVYLIHIFLLPYNLEVFTTFRDHPMPIIEAATSLSIALVIVAASLLIGSIIRLSPFLAHWVFGAKYPGDASKHQA